MIPRRFIPAEFNVCLAVLVFSLPVHLFSRFAVGHLLYSFSTTTPSDTPTLDLPTRTTFSKRLIAKFFHGSSFVPVFGCRADRLADLRLSEGVEIRRCIKRGSAAEAIDRPATDARQLCQRFFAARYAPTNAYVLGRSSTAEIGSL
jgi:hypothetical protein